VQEDRIVFPDVAAPAAGDAGAALSIAIAISTPFYCAGDRENMLP
jgi:hypothetical protein